MLRKIKLPFITAILGIIASAVFLIWFNNIHGAPGLLYWHTDIQLITGAFKVFLVLIPVLFVLLAFLQNKRIAKIVTYSISCIVNFIAILMCAGLMCYILTGAFSLDKDYTRPENLLVSSDVKELSSIAISSDPHWGTEKANNEESVKILKKAGHDSYDAFFCLGDISDWGDTKGGYEEPVKAFNENLNGKPLFAMMGNHDALIDASGIFNQIFYENKKHEQYYRMDFGDVHFIILDLLWGAEEYDDNQKNWLISQLESIPQEEKVIVLTHAFFVSSGYVDKAYNRNWYDNPLMIEKLCPVFEKYKVDLVISGHNHLMELLEKDGVTYIVIGAMGGKLDYIEYNSPYSLWLNNEAFGYLSLDLAKEDKLSFTFCDSNGKELKSHEISTK